MNIAKYTVLIQYLTVATTRDKSTCPGCGPTAEKVRDVLKEHLDESEYNILRCILRSAIQEVDMPRYGGTHRGCYDTSRLFEALGQTYEIIRLRE